MVGETSTHDWHASAEPEDLLSFVGGWLQSTERRVYSLALPPSGEHLIVFIFGQI